MPLRLIDPRLVNPPAIRFRLARRGLAGIAVRLTTFVVAVVMPSPSVWAQGAEQSLNTRVTGATYTVSVFIANTCSGTHTIEMPTVTGAPGLKITGPSTVTVAPGDDGEFTAELDLTNVAPGEHKGTLTFNCVTCGRDRDAGLPCAFDASSTITFLAVDPSLTTGFGSDPRDANFGGLVNGQPVQALDLVKNIVTEIENTPYGQTPRAQTIIKELREDYLDWDITFVPTVNQPPTTAEGIPAVVTGTVGTDTIGSGNARYERTPWAGGGLGGLVPTVWSEQIYFGVDQSVEGIYRARADAANYYAFLLDGKMAVVNKADLVHNIFNEGVSAVNSGLFNVGGRAPFEEELDSFNAGNEAAAALGLPPDTQKPNLKGYGAATNPSYQSVSALPTAPGPNYANAPGQPLIIDFASLTYGTSYATTPTAVRIDMRFRGTFTANPGFITTHSLDNGTQNEIGVPFGIIQVMQVGENPPIQPLSPVKWLLASLFERWRTSVAMAMAQGQGNLRGFPGSNQTPVIPNRGGVGGRRASVKAFFVSLGRSTGEAFKVIAVNDGDVPGRLSGDAFVLEPVARLSEREAEAGLQKLSGRRPTVFNINGYCLQFNKPPPRAGQVFRLAPVKAQAESVFARAILLASERLQEAGRLQPDSNPREYLHSVRQWAIWTKEQGFNEKSFTEAFLEHAKKNLAAAGRPWTNQLELGVRGLAPARWRDIGLILRDADTVVAPRPTK